MIWIGKHPQFHPDMLGYLVDIFDERDPSPAREQVNAKYAYGGGWSPMKGFTLSPDGNLYFPGDRLVRLLAEAILHPDTSHPEVIRLYEHSWVVIIQPDSTYEVCRMD